MSTKNTGIVKFTFDPKHPPKLTAKAKASLAALRDEDIDLTEIPETIGVEWRRPGLLASAANKAQITLRLDADVLAYFRKTGRRYQTRMNEVLRMYMEAQAVNQRGLRR